ncbi:MAG TPA: hypothetical protein VK783_04605 [Bacteroidia bacterium]|jgi:hypothetical protein|nr:hypothetical protein [Bacteroidia bacterium]
MLTTRKYSVTLFLFLISHIFCLGQASSSSSPFPDPFETTHYVYASWNLSVNTVGDVMPSSGTHLQFGFNLARFVSHKVIFGAFIDFRGFRIFSSTQYSKLTPAINSNIILNQNNPYDSTRANFLSTAYNNSSSTQVFSGSYYDTYGIFFSPFPRKYGCFMLQAAMGSYDFAIGGAYTNKYLGGGDNPDNIDLVIPITYTFRLTFKPFSFIKNTKEESLMWWLGNFVFLSYYYEQISFQKGTLDGVSLTKYLMPAFFNQYGTATHMGFTISFGIY